MKTSIKIAIAALIIASFGFEGCKKGPNDPFLSIHTRKARVAGEWTLKSGSGTDVNNSQTTTWTFDGSNYSETDQSGTFTAGLKWTFTFEKDGTFKTVQTTTYGGAGGTDVVTETGTWNFTGRVGEDKNADHIIMKTLSSQDVYSVGSSSTTTTDTYTGDDAPTSLYYLDELKNKEMIFTWDGTSSYTPSSTSTSSKGTMTLEQ